MPSLAYVKKQVARFAPRTGCRVPALPSGEPCIASCKAIRKPVFQDAAKKAELMGIRVARVSLYRVRACRGALCGLSDGRVLSLLSRTSRHIDSPFYGACGASYDPALVPP